MHEENPFFLLKNINDKFEARGNSDCQKAGLTLSQFRVLIHLTENQNRAVTQKEMELLFRVSHPTITGILKRMEEKELITTEITKKGKTQKLVFITEKGKEALAKIDNSREADNKKLQQYFSQEEINNLDDYLHRILNFLNE